MAPEALLANNSHSSLSSSSTSMQEEKINPDHRNGHKLTQESAVDDGCGYGWRPECGCSGTVEVQIGFWLCKDFAWLCLYPYLSFPCGACAAILQVELLFCDDDVDDDAAAADYDNDDDDDD